MEGTLLIRGRAVLTGRLDRAEILDGGVVVANGAIVAVGNAVELRRQFEAARELGGADRIVMPGLVSAHQHGAGVTSLQLGCPDQPFERWLIEMLGIPALDVRLDTQYHASNLIANGITTTLHSHYTRDPSRYELEVQEILDGYSDAGMRVAFAPCYLDRNYFTYGEDEAFVASLPAHLAARAGEMARPTIPAPDYLALVRRLAAASNGTTRRILFGPVAPQWCTPEALAAIGQAVRDGERGAHLHLLESRAQRDYLDRSLGESIVEYLDRLGLVGPTVSFAHGVWLTADEMDRLADRGSTVVLNPGCNLRLGNGIAPIGELVRRNVPIGIGTDDMTLADDDDLFAEARLVAALARPTGTWLNAAARLRAACWGGARAAQFDDLVGSLQPGKRADIVLLDATRIVEPFAAEDAPLLDLTMARARGSDVRSVLIDGEVVFDGETPNRNKIARDLREATSRQAAVPAIQARVQLARDLAARRAVWPDRVVSADYLRN